MALPPRVRSVLLRWLGVTSGVIVMPSAPGTMETADVAGLSAVVRAVGLLATDCARADIQIFDSKGNLLTDHPVYALLGRNANEYQTGFDFRRTLTAAGLYGGNGLALIRHDDKGDAYALDVLPQGVAVPHYTEERGIVYRIGGEDMAPDSILHLGAHPDPLRPLWFQSPIEAAAQAHAGAADAVAVLRAIVRTGTTGKLAISADNGGSDEVAEAIHNRWKTMHGTPAGAALPIVMRTGMSATNLTPAGASDMLVSACQWGVEEVGRAFGVPVELLLRDGKFSQPDAARMYVEGGLALWLEAWAAQVQAKLCREGERVRFSADWISDGSLKDSSQAISKLQMVGTITANEGRARLGYPRSSDPNADRLLITMPGGAPGAVGMAEGNQEASVGDAA